mmetsp:Transcript_24781/g.68565  ORF Transcript_24781/g.68565 Transcript_24781/m.68565 type:complete len:220 (-) Transcript_24781:3214-3873(-)
MNALQSLLLFFALARQAQAFSLGRSTFGNKRSKTILLATEQPLESERAAPAVKVDPKEAVKVFGRLAEKYIMLDASAGMCCYSACTDCEFRLPDGGYRMADQSAARPKWIPNYEYRSANGKEHTTKWRSELFREGPALSQAEFVERLKEMSYMPTLGGPYLGASAAAMENDTAAKVFFDALSDGKDVLTRNKMSVRLKQLADGEEGMTWNSFERAMGLK